MALETIKEYIKWQQYGSETSNAADSQPNSRVAILADHATQNLTSVLRGVANNYGFHMELYEADYGTAALEVFDTNSRLYSFKPDVVIYSICVQKYRDRYNETSIAKFRHNLPEQYLGEVTTIIDRLINSGVIVIINNLALPIERQFGNYGIFSNQSLFGSVNCFNKILNLAVTQRPGCVLNDVMYISSRVGSENFLDERLWLAGKYLCANRYLPTVARSLLSILLARKGKLTKVLVLDLDNTLWGGVIGDDGIDGIRLGGSPEGDAYKSFQAYIKSLKDRGYILTVCSKNNESIALDAFCNHPEMVLKEDDIALFVINWNDKASNIEYISRVLNLGLDSFIFIDDMPFERELVRNQLPMVTVPEMPQDVSDYISAIEFSNALEAIGFSEDDVSRSSKYRVEALRSEEQHKYRNINDYLIGLDMRSECQFFLKKDIPRIVQLIQRSNQFNLRTQRINELQCVEYLKGNRKKIGIQVRLSDRFGDYGLIAVVCCDVIDGFLFITELVMSCRVLKRGVESLIMNFIFLQCENLGLKGVRGEYIATSKNALVKDFFSQFGFILDSDEPSKTCWHLLKKDYKLFSNFISEVNYG